MSNYPNISTGLGKFTPDLFARLMVMLQAYESDPSKFKTLNQKGKGGEFRKTFVGKITHTGDISGQPNRFRYTVDEQVPNDFVVGNDWDFVQKPGGFTALKAVNTVEVPNTSSSVAPGIDLSASDFPDGMSLQPIKDGTLAICHVLYDERGEQVACFTVANAVDGSCD
tara:strand:+ start:1416 stop:1919 length:504 start_codon:yes stop_codon:yes gene_type:complete